MTNKLLFPALVSACFLLLTNCELPNDAEDSKNDEQSKLKQYLRDHHITVQPQPSGLYYIEEATGTGISPDSGDFVLINYSCTLIDGTLVETNDSAVASHSNTVISSVGYIGPQKSKLYGHVKYNYSIGLEEGLSLMKEGGKATLIIPSKLAFGDIATSLIPWYSTLIYKIDKLVRVIKDPVADDRIFVNRYLDTLGLQPSDSIKGIYLKEDVLGSGDLIAYGDTLKIKMMETAVDTIFFFGYRNYIEYEFISGVEDTLLGTGFNTAIEMLRKGSEARFLLPYNVAYGENGLKAVYYGLYSQLARPPYSSVFYKVIVQDVKKGIKAIN
jgi:FKBP-type peptidyl-prolyl cis-trans isomerase